MHGALVHPDYIQAASDWERARDVLAGEDAIKQAGTKYLPRLNAQTDKEFDDYLTRACFFNATGRTLDGFLGLIFRKPSNINLDISELNESAFLEDVDLFGSTLNHYARTVCSETLAIGRSGTLIDWSSDELRPYLAFYRAENILDWQTERINGRPTLKRILLQEDSEIAISQNGPNTRRQPVTRLREVKLTDDGVKMLTWLRDNDEWKNESDILLIRKGQPLKRIPFVFHSPNNESPAIQKSPITDLININLDHYRLTADYRHGIHYTALPTAWVSGFDKESTLRIGSGTAWVTEQAGATAGFLEFKGQGLETFERALDRDERIMAVLGSRMLEQTKKVAESAEAIRIRQMAEGSLLAGIITAINISISKCLKWAAWWTGTEEQPEQIKNANIELNLDYQTAGLTSMEIIAIVQAWQAGAMSREQMEGVFKQGELLPPHSVNKDTKNTPAPHRNGTPANLAVNLTAN